MIMRETDVVLPLTTPAARRTKRTYPKRLGGLAAKAG